MKGRSAVVVSMLLCLIQTVKAQQIDSLKMLSNRLDAILQAAHQFFQFNGSIYITYQGTTLLNKGYGYGDLTTKAAADSNTIYQIGSITKEFTSTIIMHLKENGQLSLEDHLSDYITGIPNGNKITIRQLLTHSSGIYDYTSDLEREDSAVICHPVPKERILRQFASQPLDFEPGTSYRYSNSGYFLLGMIIEKITGKSWEENVREEILDPLNMDHTGFDFNGLKDPKKARGYQFFNEERSQADICWDSTVSYAAGSIYSDTKDMLKWAKAVTSKSILSAQSWKEAFTVNRHGYGFGWEIDSIAGNKVLGHNGGIPGFSSEMLIIPSKDLQMIILSNVHENTIVTPLSKILAAIILKTPYKGYKPRKLIMEEPKKLAHYTGHYRLDKGHIATVMLKNKKLYIEAAANRLPETALFAYKHDAFIIGNVLLDITLKFERNKSGEIIRMQSDQGGEVRYWNKIK